MRAGDYHQWDNFCGDITDGLNIFGHAGCDIAGMEFVFIVKSSGEKRAENPQANDIGLSGIGGNRHVVIGLS